MHVLTTAPATEPITLADAKAHLYEDQNHNDSMITGLIVAARQLTEEYLRRKLITQTVTEYFECFEKNMKLEFPNVSTINSIKYLTDDETESTDIKTNFILLSGYQPSEIIAKDSYSLPSPFDRKDTVRIEYVTGFGAASAIPKPIIQGMLVMIGEWYECREDETFVSKSGNLRMSKASQLLMQIYRLWGV